MTPTKDYVFANWREAAQHATSLFDKGEIDLGEYQKIMALAKKEAPGPGPNLSGLLDASSRPAMRAPTNRFGAPTVPTPGLSVPNFNFGAESVPGGARYQAGISTPFAGGELGAEGSYVRPSGIGGPPDWSASMKYRRTF